MKNKSINLKLITTLLIITTIIICLFRFFPNSSATPTDFSGGTGTSEDPYIISTVQDIQKLANNVNNGTTYSGFYFNLANDISLEEVTNWNPIGYSTTSTGTTNGFSGVFNGNGNTIKNINLVLTESSYKSGRADLALFGATTGALIHDLNIENIIIKNCLTTTLLGDTNLAAITGASFNSTIIYNCTVKNFNLENCISIDENTTEYVYCIGGITATLDASSSVKNCSIDENEASSSTENDELLPENEITTYNLEESIAIDVSRIGTKFTLLANLELITNPTTIIWKDQNNNQIGTTDSIDINATNTEQVITLVVTNDVGESFETTYTIPAITLTISSIKTEGINYNVTPIIQIGDEIIDNSELTGYTYKWIFSDGDTKETTEPQIQIVANLNNQNINLEILKDGTTIQNSLNEITIPALDLKISLKQEVDIVTVSFDGNDKDLININDFTFYWYRMSDNQKIAEGTTIETINLESGKSYQVIGNHKNSEKYNLMSTFTYTKEGLNTVIYVNYNSGSDSNNGFTAETPVKTIGNAIAIIKQAAGAIENNIDTNKIIVIGQYTGPVDYTFDVPVTVTGKYNEVDYSGEIYFNIVDNIGINLQNSVKFENLIFNGNGGATTIYCQGNSITMGDGIKMKNYSNYSGNDISSDVSIPNFQIIGGFLNYNGQTYNQSNITIKSGTYSRIIGGNRNTVESTVFASSENPFNSQIDIEYSIADSGNIQIGLISGGQEGGNGYYNSTINIKNGNISRVLGGSTTSNISTNIFNGNTSLNITGGFINELYGGSYGINTNNSIMNGNININISAGTINNNLYAAGIASQTGTDSSPIDINLNLTGGAVEGDIYGAGKAIENASNSNTFGNININLENKVCANGNIYGASQGIESNSDLATTTGNTNIKLSNISNTFAGDIYGSGIYSKQNGNTNIIISNAVIDGNIFGGSFGSSATVTGNTNIEINTLEIYGSIYGGGYNSQINGDTKIYAQNIQVLNQNGKDENKIIDYSVDGITAGGSVFGGSYNSTVNNTSITIKSGEIDGDVFGGANSGIISGNTELLIGDESSKLDLIICGTLYAGGKGDNSAITGNTITTISGMKTEITTYGSSNLGKIDNDITINFNNYSNDSKSKYKLITGIDNATNINLTNSYVQFSEGLIGITNLNVPSGSGIILDNDSTIAGDFSGGGIIYLNSSVCLTISGNIKSSGQTKLTLNPQYIEQQKDNISQITGIQNPYIKLFGIDETSGTGFISGYPGKYTILYKNKGDVVEDTTIENIIYYIDESMVIDNYIESEGIFVQGKKYSEQIDIIDDVSNIHILSNSNFSTLINVNYTIDTTNEITKGKSLTRTLLLQNQKVNISYPIGTQIIMKTNDEYYGYTVTTNITGINLNEFTKLENTEKYSEISDITTLLNNNIYSENYRFIIDFSNCQTGMYLGEYDLVLEITDGTEGYAISESKNLINVESRTYSISEFNLDRNSYEPNGKIIIKGILNLGAQSDSIQSNEGNKISAIITLKDSSGNIIEIPDGTNIKFGENNYYVTNKTQILDILNNIGADSISTDFEIELDMSGVIQESEKLDKGSYELVLEIYSSENNILLSNSLLTKTLNFAIIDKLNYGMNAQIMNELNSDQLQLVKNGDTRSIEIENNTTELNGAEIRVVLQKRTGPFTYTTVKNSISEESIKIDESNEILDLEFDSLDSGVYRIVLELYDQYGTKYTTQNMNFIVE